MFVGAAIVALPAVIAMQLVTLAFGVVSRAAPQLNIFGVGFPVILSTGFIIMMLAVPTLLPQIEKLMSDALTAVSLLGTGEH